MFKKVIATLILISLIGLSANNYSEAGFFRKSKAAKKQVTEEKTVEEKKVLVVEIYASWCPGCKNIQPTLDQLAKETPGIEVIQLDVSTPSKAQASLKQAKELKIIDFYNSNKSKTATVAIIVPSSGEIVSLLENNNDLEAYKVAVEEAKTKEKSLQNPPA